jgi:predicted kinase
MNEENKKISNCYMLIGVPGSGKSTLTKKLLQETPLEIVSTDAFIDQKAKEENMTYEQSFEKYNNVAPKWMKKQLAEILQKKQSFIWDQTNVVQSARKKKLKLLNVHGYSTVAYYFDLSQDEIWKRIKKREFEGGKIITPKLMNMMQKDYTFPVYDEGFDKIYKINDLGEIIYMDPIFNTNPKQIK